MNTSASQHRALTEPPGGVLMWLIVALELVTFGIVFVMVGLLRVNDAAAFRAGQAALSPATGLLLTLVLVTSGALAAEGVHAGRAGAWGRARAMLAGALALGLGFVGLKVHDTRAHLLAGHTLGSSDFWDAYLLGTGFHFMHVVVGLVLLGWAVHRLGKTPGPDVEDIAAIALFWHLCDLAWFFLFPLFFATGSGA